MIKQVYKVSSGETYTTFDDARIGELSNIYNQIGELIQKNMDVNGLANSVVRQRLQIANLLTGSDCEKFSELLKEHALVQSQTEPDQFIDD